MEHRIKKSPAFVLAIPTLLAVLLSLLALPSVAAASFGVGSFSVSARNADGTPDFGAGSHPFAYSFDFTMNTNPAGEPEGSLRGLDVDLPPGMVGNAQAVPRCSRAEFDGIPRCSPETQVGLMRVATIALGEVALPIYNLNPPAGYAAAFGGGTQGNSVIELVSLAGSGPGTHLRISVPSLPGGLGVRHVAQTLWGVPADPGHDGERGTCLQAGGSCPVELPPAPLLTLPASCDGPLATTLTVRSLAEPPLSAAAPALSLDAGGNPQGLIGCDALPFSPSFSTGVEGHALAPSAISFNLDLPPAEGIPGRSAATLRRLSLSLPPGFALSPAAAAGLAACSPDQIGLTSAPGIILSTFDSSQPSCPEAAKIGTAAARTPLLDHPLSGPIYLAASGQNPFLAAFAIYLVLDDPLSGTIVKVPGRIDPDPSTGQLEVTIADLPPVPLGSVSVDFSQGPRALIAAPSACGTYATSAELEPEGAPETPTSDLASTLTLTSGPAGTACPPPEAERNAAPTFQAGSEALQAGSATSLVIDLSREGTDQQLGSFDLTLPPGLIANLGSTPLGAAIGTVRATAGLGPEPLALPGTAYLRGPYKGAPYSLEAVIPARAGPFDLGTISERAAIDVDPLTAQISARADPLPQILEGVPLQLRGLRIDLDRPGFIRNPTSCEPTRIAGTATTALGQTVSISDRFQVGDCAALPFKPRLSLGLSGQIGRNGHPALRAVLHSEPEGAALAGAGFTLPADELLDLRHLPALCPQGTAPDLCPRGSRLGTIRLDSPSLDGPAEGPVYLRVPSHRLPELSAEVGAGRLSFRLHGRTTDSGGRLGLSLTSLPDIPLSRAVLSLAGGRRGIVVNSRSLCAFKPITIASFSAHSGKNRRLRVRAQVHGRC